MEHRSNDPKNIAAVSKRAESSRTESSGSDYDKMIDEYITSKGLDQTRTDLLTPQHLYRSKLREEIKAKAEPTDLMEYVNLAVHTLINKGSNCVDPEAYQSMVKQFSETKSYFKKFNFTKPFEENFMNMLHFTASTMNTMFQITQYEYSNDRLEESLSIFALLSLFEPEDPDYWYRLGIIAHQLKRYELALGGFTNAVSLYPDFLEARIFLADTYAKLCHMEEAKHQIEQIKEQIKTTSLEPIWQEMIQEMKQEVMHNTQN